MAEIKDLKKIFAKAFEALEPDNKERLKSLTRGMNNLEVIVNGALFDPDIKIRENLIKMLNRVFENTLYSGFVADNQVYIVLKSDNYIVNEYLGGTYLVCDMPKTYAGGVCNSRARFNRKKE